MINPMEELSFEVNEAFEKLEKGVLPSKSEIEALKYAAGFTKPYATTLLTEVFDSFNDIFNKAKK
jgi:hypothetical protein